MTEQRAQYYAERLALSMGATFYVVRSREDQIYAVQVPFDGYEILAIVPAPATMLEQDDLTAAA